MRRDRRLPIDLPRHATAAEDLRSRLGSLEGVKPHRGHARDLVAIDHGAFVTLREALAYRLLGLETDLASDPEGRPRRRHAECTIASRACSKRRSTVGHA